MAKFDPAGSRHKLQMRADFYQKSLKQTKQAPVVLEQEAHTSRARVPGFQQCVPAVSYSGIAGGIGQT